MTSDERRKKVRKRYREQAKKSLSQMSLQERDEAYKATFRATRDPRQAVKSYCQGNKWLEENARAVGNWPRGR